MNNTHIQLMATLVAKAKSYSATHVPAPTDELVEDWADLLKLERFPPKLWGEAVQMWARNPQKEFLDPGVLQSYAYRVRDLWEADPVKREILQQRRQAYLSARIARGELPVGTTPIVQPEAGSDANLDGSVEQRKKLKRILEENQEKRWEQATTLERAKIRAKQEQRDRRKAAEERARQLAEQLKNDKENL